jgi:uncharacterized protein YjbI with pentapeptide repeats
MNQEEQSDAQENQDLLPSEIEILINTINLRCIPKSSYYGQLVKWKIRNEWFYGIGLSDKVVFDTNNLEIRPGNVENGLPVFIVKNRHSHFNEFEIIERLKYTLDYIDSKKNSAESSREKWNGEYNKDWWNDEHLSRFISNNEVVSYKVKTPSKENKKQQKQKQKQINSFLDDNNPDNSSFKITNFNLNWRKLSGNWRVWLFPFIAIGFAWSIAYGYHWASLGFLFTAVLIIILSLLSRYEWSGFQNKRGWDWLALLIVPVVLAVAVNFVQNDIAARQKDSDLSKAQEQALLEYFKNVKDIVQKDIKGKDAKESNKMRSLSEENKKLMTSFTKAILSEINGDQKRQVIDFLYGQNLIRCDDICGKSIYEKNIENLIDLSEANFEKANLSRMKLLNLYLPNVNLNEADFTKSNLDGATFKGSSLNKTKFQLASYSGALFSPNSDDNFYYSEHSASNNWSNNFVNRVNNFVSRVNNFVKWIQSFFVSKPMTNTNYYISKLQLIQYYQSLSRLKGQEPDDYKKNPEKYKDKMIYTEMNKKDNKDYQTNFSELKLENLYLGKANFKDVDLSGTSLKNSFLEDTDLRDAKLKNTNLEGAYLKGVKISNIENFDKKTQLVIKLFCDSQKFINELINNINNKNNLDLSNSDLSTIEIDAKDKPIKINLQKAKLIRSHLKNIKINGQLIDLTESDLRSATLENIDLSNTKLESVDMRGVIMKGNNKLNNVTLFVVDLTGAIISADFTDSTLNSVKLEGADLRKSKNLNKIKFSGTTYDSKTQFPKGFDQKKTKGLRLI